jgi:hypothetical protein
VHDAVRLRGEIRRKVGLLATQVQPGAGDARVEASDQPAWVRGEGLGGCFEAEAEAEV